MKNQPAYIHPALLHMTGQLIAVAITLIERGTVPQAKIVNVLSDAQRSIENMTDIARKETE